MGNINCERLCCCFRRSSDEENSQIRYESYSSGARGVTPVDPETRRQLQAEAAERRLAESTSRGIADPERIINYDGMLINLLNFCIKFHQFSVSFVFSVTHQNRVFTFPLFIISMDDRGLET
ncbi:unnamed protein product [Heterobilharzia americana]|nr:unnamed protein product [Heterobilharzia americana]